MHRLLIRFALSFVVIVIAALVAFAWFGSSALLTPHRRSLEVRHQEMLDHPAEFGMKLEDFKVQRDDGVVLAGIVATRSPVPGKAFKTRSMADRLGHSLTAPPAHSGTVFILHGRSGVKEDMLAIAERFVAADFRCILYDARCHGESGGTSCTFGHSEVADFRAVMDACLPRQAGQNETPERIVAFGISLGAAVILQTLPQEPRIEAAVAVSPFADLSEIAERSVHRGIHHRIPRWLVSASLHTAGLRAGFDPFRIRPIDTITATTVPLLLVHGMQDALIPVDHSQRLLAASAGSASLRLVPDGTHGNVLAKGGDDLYEEAIRFLLDH